MSNPTNEPPQELFASYRNPVSSPFGQADYLLVTNGEEVLERHAQPGRQVRVGRYQLVEVKTLTAEAKFT